jgi:hypothetical protein
MPRMTACLAEAKADNGGSTVAGEKNEMCCVELIPFCMFVSIYIHPGFPESGISTLTSLVRLLEFHRACLSTLLYKSNPERDD